MQLIFLRIPEFPTPQKLWAILAETRRLRRNGRDRASFGNHSPTVKELKNHENKVMNLLAGMGVTV
jgi:hypothetical protein